MAQLVSLSVGTRANVEKRDLAMPPHWRAAECQKKTPTERRDIIPDKAGAGASCRRGIKHVRCPLERWTRRTSLVPSHIALVSRQGVERQSLFPSGPPRLIAIALFLATMVTKIADFLPGSRPPRPNQPVGLAVGTPDDRRNAAVQHILAIRANYGLDQSTRTPESLVKTAESGCEV